MHNLFYNHTSSSIKTKYINVLHLEKKTVLWNETPYMHNTNMSTEGL